MDYYFEPAKLFVNPAVWCALSSWMMAQLTKMLCGISRTKRVDFSYLVSTGGMPSAHSAMAMGMAMGVGYMSGFDSSVFGIALGVASLTMFDASTVRRAAGQQARVLNEMVDELLKDHRLSEKKLKELLGHTRLEVLMGAIVGILTSTLIMTSLAAR